MVNKRYNTLTDYYEHKYHCKVFKVSLNAGFSCPNKVNGHGCIFCSKLGSGDFAGNPESDLITQFNEVKEIISHKWPHAKYIGYFQANTNTFAPVKQLKEKYETILKLPNVVGLNIATRCDAITPECLDYLTLLNKQTDLTIELGLQTSNEKTLKLINRGHNLQSFTDMVHKLKDHNIKVVVHIINGLPGETKADMLKTIEYLNSLNIDGLKIHMLHIIKDTVLNDMYIKNPFHILTKDEYIDIVCDQLEILNDDVIIHRLTGDPKIDDLVTPDWLIKKFVVLNDIDKELKRRNTYQGQRKKAI